MPFIVSKKQRKTNKDTKDTGSKRFVWPEAYLRQPHQLSFHFFDDLHSGHLYAPRLRNGKEKEVRLFFLATNSLVSRP